MSGICGSIAFNPSAPVDGIDAMIDAAPWRGPDGVGVWRGEGAVLAHQALQVTPESRYEDQPLVNEEAGLVLVADARIDNREELQRTLRRDLRRSVRRDVITDADLILAAYRRWGTDCAARLLGDFAFAVWDRRKRQLFAARDPMAMRPFYYRIEDGRVLFGSEVKQILAAPGVPREIFEPMVAMHLCGRFDRLDWTFYEGISQLEPAHALVVTSDRAYRTWRYWDIDPTHQIRYKNEQDYVEHFRSLFKEAVRCRMRSHKPVGLFLSGGLDSGSIASMAGHLKETEGLNCPELKTYSFYFPTLIQCDERNVSDKICERYNFIKNHINAEAKDALPLNMTSSHVADLDSPFQAEYRSLEDYTIERAANSGVRFMLSGLRGDLINGMYIFNYPKLFLFLRWIDLFNELNLRGRYGGESLLKEFEKQVVRPILNNTVIGNYFKNIVKSVISFKSYSKLNQYPDWVYIDLTGQIPVRIKEDEEIYFKEFINGNNRRLSIILSEMHMFVAEQSERYQVKKGVKAGDPWSDMRLAEFSVCIPQRILNKTGKTKDLAKKAIKPHMPSEAYNNLSKVSMHPLFDYAIRDVNRDQITTLSKRMVSHDRGFVNGFIFRKNMLEYLNGNSVPLFWPALTLELWLRKHW